MIAEFTILGIAAAINECGYVCMRDTGDITLNVEAYDGMYDASLDMMILHTWKDTFLYFDGTSYNEYGAAEIPESAYLQYENASEIRKTMDTIHCDTREVRLIRN